MTDRSFAQGLVGVTLDGRYRLDAVLGEGGMGSVFRATQLAMDRKVAVKLLKPHLTSDAAALERFAREARATFRVDSPHAVKILDFGVTPLGDYYMVLEYLDGRTVHREIEVDGPFAPPRVAHIAHQALHALGVAHAQGMIHRDVKPDNLLLMRVGGDPDYTKILDFGVAKVMQGAASDPAQLALTAAGMVFGTPEFMSPEQACGQALDGRSDLYSLAATMFVMLTGTPLFEGKTPIELLTHHARTPAPHLAVVRPELAAYAELDELLQRCLAKQREDRPDSAAAMAQQIAALAATLDRRPSATSPRATAAPASAPVFHPSSYVHALTDAPAAPPATAGEVPRALPRTGLPRAARRSRRGLYLWLGGVAIASLIGVAVGGMVRKTSRTASITPSTRTSISAPAATPVDAAPASEAPHDGAPPDAEPPDAPRHAPPVTPPRVPAARSAEAEAYLRNAEDAYRAGNTLRQVNQADLALRADPRSIRAKYLLADALIKDGDLDHGCAYLRELRRSPMARTRARAAGCPGD